MTRYVVWCPDRNQTREDGEIINVRSPSAACEKWAELDDLDSAGFPTANGNAVELMVAELGSSLAPFKYSVVCEAVPSYHAMMLHGRSNAI